MRRGGRSPRVRGRPGGGGAGAGWERGRVAGSDADLDLAVIEVGTGDVSPLSWPDDELEPEIGRVVFALGNPGGRGLRVTPGFISSVARSFRGPRGRRIRGAIEHTAPLPR